MAIRARSVTMFTTPKQMYRAPRLMHCPGAGSHGSGDRHCVARATIPEMAQRATIMMVPWHSLNTNFRGLKTMIK